jgi:L-asparaginase
LYANFSLKITVLKVVILVKKEMDPTIQIFITGGTFDKSYNYIKGNLYFEKTHLPEMLKRSRCQLNIKVKTLMMLDSLEMREEDTLAIIKACKNTSCKYIVITHGTDRITHTAEALAQANISNKTILLTGAMIPYAFGSSSDGFFNLGCALAYVQTLDPQVYITMQGQYFLWNKVKKNKHLGYFERI